MAVRKVLIAVFPEFNTLDMNGPFETLHSPDGGDYFAVTLASETEITTSSEGVMVKRHVPIDQALIESVSDFDVLVVPGGPSSGPDSPIATQAAKTSEPFLKLIAAFASSPPTQGGQRTLLSVCTGAIFLATLGVFNGLHCTTHWDDYAMLKRVAQEAAASSAEGEAAVPGKVLAARYVDAGLNRSGVRIVSSGGVSCGIDASLHVLKLYAGEEAAVLAASGMDYAWRKTEGVVFM